MLNTERLTIGKCVDEIAALLDEPQFQETAESRRVFANLALESHVRAALRADPRTSKMTIGIAALDGRITLSGVLESGLEERDAIAVAKSVTGVADVDSRLRSASLPAYKVDSA